MRYTTNCNTQSSAPEDGQNNCPKHVELIGIINKPLLLHLVGCLYYLYTSKFKKSISKFFNFFYSHFCFGSRICELISGFKNCAVVSCHGSPTHIFILHAVVPPPSYFRYASLNLITSHQFQYTQHFSCVTVMNLSFAKMIKKPEYKISLPNKERMKKKKKRYFSTS